MCAGAASTYAVESTTEAKRDIKRLQKSNKQVAKSVARTIRALGTNPRPPGVVHLGGDTYRVRDGEFRIIYDIDDSKREVWVQRIRDRKDAYK